MSIIRAMSREWWAGYRRGYRDAASRRWCECIGCRIRRWFR